MPVAVFSDACSCILSCKRTCSHAAVPESDGVFSFVHGHRVSEECRFACEMHSHVHGKRTVGVRLTACSHSQIVEYSQYRAYRSSEGGEEIRPASGCQSAYAVLLHIFKICLVEPCKVLSVSFRCILKAHGPLLSIRKESFAFFIREGLGLFHEWLNQFHISR